MFKSSFQLLASAAVLSSVALMGCEKTAENQPAQSEEATASKVPEAYPGQSGIIKTGEWGGQPITYQEINGDKVIEGDILLTDDQVNPSTSGSDQQRPSGAGRTTQRWPSGIVYYTIASNLPNQKRVTDAIAHWQQNTRIRFVKRTNQRGYVKFQLGSGCSANLGYTGGEQYVNLAAGCDAGVTIHEIGHALGLFHEQTRNDRDNYITIKRENIPSEMLYNFEKYSQQNGVPGKDYFSFDFNSIMLYSSYAFSTNGKPTIVKKNGQTFTAQITKLSSGDKNTISVMYPKR